MVNSSEVIISVSKSIRKRWGWVVLFDSGEIELCENKYSNETPAIKAAIRFLKRRVNHKQNNPDDIIQAAVFYGDYTEETTIKADNCGLWKSVEFYIGHGKDQNPLL